jgi:hypothetical protein
VPVTAASSGETLSARYRYDDIGDNERAYTCSVRGSAIGVTVERVRASFSGKTRTAAVSRCSRRVFGE